MIDLRHNAQIDVGIDIGSTTIKLVAITRTPSAEHVILRDYRRHHARQRDSIREELSMLRERIGSHPFRLVLTGSGASPLAKELGVPFLQEVVAGAIALRKEFPQTGTAIELGGQDAKILFFAETGAAETGTAEAGTAEDRAAGQKQIRDMRMNGVCAGGTGAFLDEVAEILHIPVEDFNDAAIHGRTVYDISGRCGVFAKTDLQPLLNQGAERDDLALSTYHAIARQTIGGLARGMRINPPVAFLGGVLHYHPQLIRVFAQRLSLKPEEILIPDHSRTTTARGAAVSCREMFSEETLVTAEALLEKLGKVRAERKCSGPLFFRDEAEKAAFWSLHPRPDTEVRALPRRGERLRGFLGLDAGSTTTKLVLLDDEGEIRWSYYGDNGGDPLKTAVDALVEMREAFREHGVSLEILRVASTGYGELLFHKAFRTDTHLVETVAHASAAAHYAGDVTFLLDIGGQDMKGIWIDQGVITDIVINEACSSGCGSFLENFASTLHISKEEIAEAAFSSRHPARLGSRCTVFMNSSIITEQREGSTPADIMAGLCRSIIENVFVKVIRAGNLDSLGARIMVQGGTFLNDAVLRAMEQYVGHEVIRAPYPGLMGAIGAALEAREHWSARSVLPTDADAAESCPSRFLGLEALEAFSYSKDTEVACPFCTNHCQRTVIRFSTGDIWVTGNRCERGVVLDAPLGYGAVRWEHGAVTGGSQSRRSITGVPDLFRLRRELLFRDTGAEAICSQRRITIGIPRVLSFWDTYPFWEAFWKTLGFDVLPSPETTRQVYEEGIPAITSDTECLPAKVVHGHLRWLEHHGADRIFFPAITAIPSENTARTSESMCALVKGYPFVIRNADNIGESSGVPLDAPLFHWHTHRDRNAQLQGFMEETFGIAGKSTACAIRNGDVAQSLFREDLMKAGEQVLDSVAGDGFAVVLAARPYHNDPLINHELSGIFTEMGIPVLPADALREVYQTDLSRLRLEPVNNYHCRMLASAILAAADDRLEYVQLGSFGCGHDAYLCDEIHRIMGELSDKTPLNLKVDESDVVGPLRIRVRSFVETVRRRRRKRQAQHRNPAVTVEQAQHWKAAESVLPDPYPVKFQKQDKKLRTMLCPNTSHTFSRLMAAVLEGQGIRTVALPVGREKAVRLGKRYVQGDMCFPAQIVIGEALEALKSGRYDPDHTVVGMAKYVGDCRLTHYSAVLRKALDDAGFPQVPIWTNDLEDARDLHPGMKLSLGSSARLAMGFPMMDALEDLLRKIRPYELVPGSADKAFDMALEQMLDGMRRHGLAGLRAGFHRAVDTMKTVKYHRSKLRPRVVIVGEFLLNFHPGANHDIERYLEKNGFEIIEAKLTDVIQKSYYYKLQQVKEYKVRKPVAERAYLEVVDRAFSLSHHTVDSIASAHPLYEKIPSLPELAEGSEEILPSSFDTGEGILIPAEIIHHARRGCRNFLILQPFGCLPNHVVGRGLIHKLQEMFPEANILALDYDPDVSFANIENRLQMMINNERLLREGL